MVNVVVVSFRLVLASMKPATPAPHRTLGVAGSLSTFSTFAVELLNELRAGQTLTAGVLAVASIGIGLLASAAGYAMGTHA